MNVGKRAIFASGSEVRLAEVAKAGFSDIARLGASSANRRVRTV
jgi:hypothetical protein